MEFLLAELGFEGWLGVFRAQGTANAKAWRCESKEVGCVEGSGWRSARGYPPRPFVPRGEFGLCPEDMGNH